MSDISPISSADRLSALSLNRVNGSGAPELEPSRSRAGDRVELSRTAQLLSKLAELPDVREDVVNEVRAQIANDTYETPAKIDATVDALLDELS